MVLENLDEAHIVWRERSDSLQFDGSVLNLWCVLSKFIKCDSLWRLMWVRFFILIKYKACNVVCIDSIWFFMIDRKSKLMKANQPKIFFALQNWKSRRVCLHRFPKDRWQNIYEKISTTKDWWQKIDEIILGQIVGWILVELTVLNQLPQLISVLVVVLQNNGLVLI